MTVLNCPLCEYATPDVECVGAASILNAHAISHQQPPQAAPAAVVRNRAPKLERPKVKPSITSEGGMECILLWLVHLLHRLRHR